jgi:predicted dehydrogenase
MHVAVIGALGSIGRRHTANLEALGCRVARVDAAFSGEEGFSLADVVAWGGDAVVIATPYASHLIYVEWAIDRRLPVFCEKPLGSLDQLPRWREIAARSDLPVHQVGYQLRFQPRYRAMRALVPRPRSGRFVCHFDMATWPGQRYGPAILEASHELDLALDCGLTAAEVELVDGAEYYRGWQLNDASSFAETHFHAADELGEQMYRDELDHFLARVRGERGLGVACDLPQAMKVLEACAA